MWQINGEKDCVLTRGPAIGHVSPEASEGGPIALVEEGDIIELDIPNRGLNIVGVKSEEKDLDTMTGILKKRKDHWVKPKPKYTKGALGVYTKLAVSPMKGGYME